MSFRRIVRVPQVAKEPRTTRRLEDIMNADELTKLTTDALDQHSVGDASVGAGLRLRDDMLATPARLATSRHLGSHSLRAAGLALSQRPDRLVAGRRGQLFRASDVWGSQTGPNPTDRVVSNTPNRRATTLRRWAVHLGRSARLTRRVRSKSAADTKRVATVLSSDREPRTRETPSRTPCARDRHHAVACRTYAAGR